MICDETIELLLSGEQFISNELDLHLTGCKRCQSLKEVLSPLCVAEFSMAETPGFDFQQNPSEEATDFAEQSAGRLRSTISVTKSHRSGSMKQLKYLAAFFSGVVASIGGIAVLRSEPTSSTSSMTSACLWETDFNQPGSESEFVKSCVACHLVTQR